ncbi:unnamed protein product [Durusdinium trenchii]|uniref:Uncharacterized protein n=1 Tax=Durusdinium trenchii TaxID=1381693 RepID=A0ABP0N4Q7_9DINO
MKACHSVPACDGCVGVNWCSVDPCPTTCDEDEITCAPEPEDDKDGKESEHDKKHRHFQCRPKKDGCPVECKDDQHKCFTPPACEGCVGMHWCSKEACPLVCNATEMGCLAENGTQFCVATSDGCPVTCRDEEFVCHLAPQCDECIGTNWCSATACATSLP